jgi:hypothetical protein
MMRAVKKAAIYFSSALVVLPFLIKTVLAASPTDDLPGIDLTMEGLQKLLLNITCWTIQAIFVIMILVLIWAGIKFFLSRGDPAEVGKARKNFTWVLVGIAVVIGAEIIVSTVSYFIGATYSPFDCSGTPAEVKYTP